MSLLSPALAEMRFAALFEIETTPCHEINTRREIDVVPHTPARPSLGQNGS